MNCNTVLTKEDIELLFSQLGINPEETQDTMNDEYYNFWDFGKEPDESQTVSAIKADITML